LKGSFFTRRKFQVIISIILAIILPLLTASEALARQRPTKTPIPNRPMEEGEKFPESAVEFTASNGSKVTLIFPDGEGVNKEENYKIKDVEAEFTKVNCKLYNPQQRQVRVKVVMSDLEDNVWRFYARDNMWDAGPQSRHVIKNWDKSPADFYYLEPDGNPSRSYGNFYFISIDSQEHGSGYARFFLSPYEDDEIIEDPETLDYDLNVKHYPPFYEPPKGQPVTASPGDVVVTLKDYKTGKPIAGKRVFIYLQSPSEMDGILAHPWTPLLGGPNTPGLYQVYQSGWFDVYPKLEKATRDSLIGLGNTDAQGKVVINYYRALGKNAGEFAEKLKKLGKLQGVINAVVIDEDLNIMDDASFTLLFKGVAEIKAIRWLGDSKDAVQKDKEGREIQVKPAISVARKSPTDPLAPRKLLNLTENDLPFYLLPGDKVQMVDGDWVDVLWATGVRMKVEVKPDLLKPGEPAYFEVADENAGWWVSTCNAANSLSLGVVLGVPGAMVSIGGYFATTSTVAAGLTIAGAILAIPALIVIGIQYYDANWEPLKFTELSEILLDIDVNEGRLTFYTLEGTANLLNDEAVETTKVSEGNKILYFPDGSTSEVTGL
jgi:hypothetical protein